MGSKSSEGRNSTNTNFESSEKNDESGEENASADPSPPPPKKRVRNAAELAKEKMQLKSRANALALNGHATIVKNSQSSGPSNSSSSDSEKNSLLSGGFSSREGSCDQNECPQFKRCALCTSQIESSTTASPPRQEYFHVSKVEHVCQMCYEDFRVGKCAYSKYVNWKGSWVSESRCVPSLRLFILEELLPFWINCRKCGQFRPIFRDTSSKTAEDVTITAKFISKFECSKIYRGCDPNPCVFKEENEVLEVRENPESFIKSISTAPLLHHSPASFYLRDQYYSDEVGMSPLNAEYIPDEEISKKFEFMSPFNIPGEPSKAFSLRPDMMEFDEVHAFPEFSIEPVPYLAMRNLVAALWSLNPTEYLTHEKCLSHLICPGFARVWYAVELKRVVNYLTMKNIINYGIIPSPKLPLLCKTKQMEVVVVGGGISGLGAARQLRSQGVRVTVLEAKTKLGGRMQDDWSLGVAVGCGAQLITGLVNNPIVLMCNQIELEFRLLSDACPLIDSVTGRLVSSVADRVVDEHFNCILDVIGNWKQMSDGPDADLASQIEGLHGSLIKHLDFKWAKEFERLLNWHVGNVEFSCGAKLSDVSAKHWDQNESVGQFAGTHALLSEGSSLLIKRLSEGMDVRCGHHVAEIDYSDAEKVLVKCANGRKFTCDKVLLCVPLTIYQKRLIKFLPELPAKKYCAFDALGAGLIEKVAVRFPRRFWNGLLKKGELDFFGNVPQEPNERGLFNMFYDFSTRGGAQKAQRYVLMSYVCGDSVELVNQKSDVEVVADFVQSLRNLFPDVDIPDPIGHVVTHWGRDPHVGMSYSYVKTGSTGEHYDGAAESVSERLYFAGECTNRFFPQTMTGAYVSALREASRIVEHWLFRQQQQLLRQNGSSKAG